MSEGAETTKPRPLARLRARRQDRRQRREWRRERRKQGYVDAYDAHNQAESSNYKKGGFFTKD